MSRSLWLAVNVALIVAAISAGWFAVNASQVARPMLAALGPVDLPPENPPLPPAPFARSIGEDAGLLSARDLFSDAAMARFAASTRDGRARPAAKKALPAARVLASPPTTPSIRPPRVTNDAREPNDKVRMRLTGVQPEVLQYFGSHLIPRSNRESDIEGAPGSSVPAPGYSIAPKGNPRGRAAGLGRTEPPATPPAGEAVAGGSTAPAAELKGPAIAASDPPQSGDALDGLILISVLRNRTGGGRALIRTPQASALAVSVGEEIVGWRVSTIGDDFINLRRGSQTRVLRMPR